MLCLARGVDVKAQRECTNYFTSNIPTLSRDTLGLGTPGTLWVRGHSAVGHSRETLGLGTPERLWLGTPERLQRGHSGGHFGVGHSKETLRWALQETRVGVGQTLGLGTPGRFWGWALQG